MTEKLHSARTLIGYKKYRAGQVVMNRMQAWSGMFGAASVDGLVSPDYAVFEVIGGNDVAFIVERLRAPDLVGRFALESKGIGSGFNRLYTDRFGPIAITLPPPTEQKAIVRFLGWANVRLERAIRAKRKVIALLGEQKQAIIHRAVTRGLDATVPLKHSGVPWLGDIPAHWEVRRAKYLLQEVDRRSVAGEETHLAMSQQFGLVPSGSVQSTLRSESYAGGKLCDSGDIVLNRLKAHLGVFAVASQNGVVSPDYTVLRAKAGVHAEYVTCILRSPACRGELMARAKGIVEGFWRLYTDDFYTICLPVPPLSEQRQIMQAMAQATAGQNNAITRLEQEVALLREYRNRLIADVVTGKLDVREVAARIPHETPPGSVMEDTALNDEPYLADEEADE
jgi:type I restriction enzyme S subunit